MGVEDSRRGSDSAPTGLIVLGVFVAVASVLALLGGAGLLVASGLWLADLRQEPREPPGQIVALIPLAGAAVGAVLGLVGVAGLTLVIVSRLARRRRREGFP